MEIKSGFFLTEFSTPDSVLYKKVICGVLSEHDFIIMPVTNIGQQIPYLVVQSFDNIYKRLLSQNTIDAREAHLMMSQHKVTEEIGNVECGNCGNQRNQGEMYRRY